MKNYVISFLEGKFWWIPLIILLVLFTSFRCMRINADAPQDLSISAALYTDEGFKTYSSRNRYFFGGWKWTSSDGYRSWYKQSPVPAYLYLHWFQKFGVSFASIRVLSVIFSVFTMLLLFFMVKRYYDIYTAYIAFAIFGCNHFLIMYNRLGFYETFLVFFILLSFFALSEFFLRLRRVMIKTDTRTRGDIPVGLACLLAGVASFLFGFFTKQSINIVVVSLLPFAVLYLFYFNHHLNRFVVHILYVMLIVIAVSYILIGNFGWFESWFQHLLQNKIFSISLKQLIPLKSSVANFDAFYISFVKSLYLEFIYNQPLTFFAGIYFALLTYYRFLYQLRFNVMDTALATWLLFGFLFLSILRYHPARYYLLLSVPLVIMCARFIRTRDYVNLIVLTKRMKLPSFRILTAVFWFYLIFYVGLTTFLHIIPFEYRRVFYNFIYHSFVRGAFANVALVGIGVLLFQIMFFVFLVPRIRNIKVSLEKRLYFKRILTGIILFQLFLHGQWLLSADNQLYDLSHKLGKVLPANSVIVGGWASDLTIENKLRALIIQGNLDYNTDVVSRIARRKKIPIVRKHNGLTVKTYEKGMPVYLLVSPNAPFERKMAAAYKHQMKRRRRVLKTVFGYFDVEMYRLDRLPGREKKILEKYHP